METKAQKIRTLVANGYITKAIKMAATFTRDFDKEEQHIIQIAKDALNGHTSFYKQLGINTDDMVLQAINLITAKYQQL